MSNDGCVFICEECHAASSAIDPCLLIPDKDMPLNRDTSSLDA